MAKWKQNSNGGWTKSSSSKSYKIVDGKKVEVKKPNYTIVNGKKVDSATLQQNNGSGGLADSWNKDVVTLAEAQAQSTQADAYMAASNERAAVQATAAETPSTLETIVQSTPAKVQEAVKSSPVGKLINQFNLGLPSSQPIQNIVQNSGAGAGPKVTGAASKKLVGAANMISGGKTASRGNNGTIMLTPGESPKQNLTEKLSGAVGLVKSGIGAGKSGEASESDLTYKASDYATYGLYQRSADAAGAVTGRAEKTLKGGAKKLANAIPDNNLYFVTPTGIKKVTPTETKTAIYGAAEFGSGAVEGVASAAQLVGGVPLAVEMAAKDPSKTARAAAFGSGLIIGSSVKAAKDNPMRLAGNIVGGIALSKGVAGAKPAAAAIKTGAREVQTATLIKQGAVELEGFKSTPANIKAMPDVVPASQESIAKLMTVPETVPRELVSRADVFKFGEELRTGKALQRDIKYTPDTTPRPVLTASEFKSLQETPLQRAINKLNPSSDELKAIKLKTKNISEETATRYVEQLIKKKESAPATSRITQSEFDRLLGVSKSEDVVPAGLKRTATEQAISKAPIRSARDALEYGKQVKAETSPSAMAKFLRDEKGSVELPNLVWKRKESPLAWKRTDSADVMPEPQLQREPVATTKRTQLPYKEPSIDDKLVKLLRGEPETKPAVQAETVPKGRSTPKRKPLVESYKAKSLDDAIKMKSNKVSGLSQQVAKKSKSVPVVKGVSGISLTAGLSGLAIGAAIKAPTTTGKAEVGKSTDLGVFVSPSASYVPQTSRKKKEAPGPFAFAISGLAPSPSPKPTPAPTTPPSRTVASEPVKEPTQLISGALFRFGGTTVPTAIAPGMSSKGKRRSTSYAVGVKRKTASNEFKDIWELI